MKFAAAMFGVLVAGACAGPTSPSSPAPVSEQILRYPQELAPVIRKLDNDVWIHPMLGVPMNVYVRRHIREIRFDGALRPPTIAYAYAGGTVGWQTHSPVATYDTPTVALEAAYVLHEARHQEGHWHSCGDERKDRTFEEHGAWAVHITYLEHQGFQKEADLLRQTFIGC